MTETLVYEQPLNEKVRALLRLEFLFAEAAHHEALDSHWDRRHSILALLHIQNILSRSDIKGDISKELDRHAQRLRELAHRDGVDTERLGRLQDELDSVIAGIGGPGQPGQRLRDHELLNAIRTRASIPGGTCSFDLPAFRHWLEGPEAEVKAELAGWWAEFLPLRDAIVLMLDMLRNSATLSNEMAQGGGFHKSLSQATPCKLVRVLLDPNLGVFPEISGGKHRFSIRFMELPSAAARPQQKRIDTAFQLACCNF